MGKSVVIENVTTEELMISIREIIKDELLKTLPKQAVYITREEVKNRLGICYPTLDKALKNGTLKAYRIRGRILFKEDELNLPEFYSVHFGKRKKQ
jgi:excisionase family DNA binding protein